MPCSAISKSGCLSEIGSKALSAGVEVWYAASTGAGAQMAAIICESRQRGRRGCYIYRIRDVAGAYGTQSHSVHGGRCRWKHHFCRSGSVEYHIYECRCGKLLFSRSTHSQGGRNNGWRGKCPLRSADETPHALGL